MVAEDIWAVNGRLLYTVPVLMLLIRGRDNIAHGPFWLGKIGFVANIVTLLWTVFTFVSQPPKSKYCLGCF